jgi:hypothetical protein
MVRPPTCTTSPLVPAGLRLVCTSRSANHAEIKVDSHLASRRRAMLLRFLNSREIISYIGPYKYQKRISKGTQLSGCERLGYFQDSSIDIWDIRTRDNVLPPTRTAQKAGNRRTSNPVRKMCSAASVKDDSLSCSGAFHFAFCHLTRCRDRSVKSRGSTAEAYPMRYARSTGRSRGGTAAKARALAIREGLAGAPLLPVNGLTFTWPRAI